MALVLPVQPNPVLLPGDVIQALMDALNAIYLRWLLKPINPAPDIERLVQLPVRHIPTIDWALVRQLTRKGCRVGLYIIRFSWSCIHHSADVLRLVAILVHKCIFALERLGNLCVIGLDLACSTLSYEPLDQLFKWLHEMVKENDHLEDLEDLEDWEDWGDLKDLEDLEDLEDWEDWGD